MEVSRTREPELFFATLGGMGLTGHILEVELLLESIPSPLIQRRSERFDSLDPLLDALGEAGKSWPFTVAWVDSLAGDEALGRGVLYCGRWATTDEAVPRAPRSRGALRVPFRMPSGLLNRTSIALFNALIYRGHGSKVKQGLVDPLRFFYPLDRIERWNWMYGSRGVTQHQCVLPERAAVAEILRCLRDSGAGSFLTVVKDCGPEGEGLLSFPRSGVSVALDLPIDGRSQEVVDALNEVVISAGGRIYLTKDGFTRRAHFERMESRRAQFARVRRRWDPEGLMRSAQSVRLFGDAP